MTTQQGDVSLFQTTDGGDIDVVDGIVSMDDGLTTMVYLSLFGGNDDDPCGNDATYSWWGNTLETDSSKMYRSQTQYLLKSVPATSNNLVRIERAVMADLSALIDQKIVNDVNVEVSIPTLNRVKIQCNLTVVGVRNSFEFVNNWVTQ